MSPPVASGSVTSPMHRAHHEPLPPDTVHEQSLVPRVHSHDLGDMDGARRGCTEDVETTAANSLAAASPCIKGCGGVAAAHWGWRAFIR